MEYEISFKESFITFSTLDISLVDTGLKSWVDGPCAIMAKVSMFSASKVGIFPPPILPTGPGCTQGLTNNAFIPFSVLKLTVPTNVSIGSPMSSKTPSNAEEPSVIWEINKLKSSKPPTPRFFRIGDSITSTNEYIAITNMAQAILIFNKNATTPKAPISMVLVVKNMVTTNKHIKSPGWVPEINTELVRLILDVPHMVMVRNANATAIPNINEFKTRS